MKAFRWIRLVLVVVVIVSIVTACGEKKFDQQLADKLQTALQDAVENPDTKFPGALLYVSSPELSIWSGAAGLGNIETSTAMRFNDKFRIGSTIKPMIAMIVLQLVEEGQFSLDDTMTAVLPESVTARFANSSSITVRMLLNHTSGMADCIAPVQAEIITNLARIWEIYEWLDIAAAQEPYFAPGQGWMYSNTDYILLGLVIEQATGRSWREEFRERIIEELNLENTLLPEPGDLSIPGNYSHGYMDLGTGLVDVTGVDPSMADAAGGSAGVMTAADMARFLDAMMTGDLFQNPETLDEMLKSLAEIPEGTLPFRGAVGYSLGIMKFVFSGGIEMVGHSGDTAGFSSFTFHLPAQGIIISGVVNDMDPLGMYYQVLIPVLEILVPGFEPISQ